MHKRNLHNLDAEHSLLASLLLDCCKGEPSEDIFAKVKVTDLYSEQNQNLFNILKALFDKGVAVDLTVLLDTLGRSDKFGAVGGIEKVTKLSNYLPSNANYNHHISIVLDYAKLRALEKFAIDINLLIGDGKSSDAIQKEIEERLANLQEREIEKPCLHITGAATDELKRIELAMDGKKDDFGISTGFYKLDMTLWGLQKSNLVIVGARPGVGKTAFALNIINHVANESHKKVAFFSLEMSQTEITRRLYSLMADVDNYELKKGSNLQGKKSDIERAHKKLLNGEMYMDDSLNTVAEMLLKAKRLKRKSGLDLIVVDYLQFVKPANKNGNRFQDVGQIARDLKAMAKELNVPVVALCQLSRRLDTAEDSPVMSDLRESGEIENNADIIMFLSQTGKTSKFDEIKKMEIEVAKNRHGVLKRIKLEYEGAKFRFKETEKQEANATELEPIEDEGLPW